MYSSTFESKSIFCRSIRQAQSKIERQRESSIASSLLFFFAKLLHAKSKHEGLQSRWMRSRTRWMLREKADLYLFASGASLFWPQSGRPRATKSREVDLSRLQGFHSHFAPKMGSGVTGIWGFRFHLRVLEFNGGMS